jgi:YD repeat-containing protein
MRCAVCSFQLAAPQAACPRCGSFLAVPTAGGAADPPRTFRYLLAGSVVFLAVLGIATSRLLSKSSFWDLLLKANPAFGQAPRERRVVHGDVVKPDELEAHGKLYFVPMGRQAIPVESLAAYYRNKFKMEITVLPEVAIGSTAYDAPRRQCIAEEMILDMRRAYSKIARAPYSTMIVLTDEDIYPRSLNWKFTYSFHTGYKFAVVSSRRNDPAFWDQSKPHDRVAQLAGAKQMLTKYIALLYFHLPHSFDPSSIMYQPLTPNDGPDDLHESDLHSEESANGFRGSGGPCLIYSYSHATGVMRHRAPDVEECGHPVPASPQEEIFETHLSTGEFFEFALDFQLDSAPPVDFHRSYRSQYVPSMALGRGTNHNYNTWLYSDGADKLSFIDIISEDGARDHLVRVSPGVGFSPSVVFENRDNAQELYGARLSWDSDHFKLQYRDTSWFTFLPCTDGRCYWSGYQDSAGHVLRFDRDASRNLVRLTASDNQGIDFQSDSQYRLVTGKDSSGNLVSYQYGVPGDLVKVTHADGHVTLYSYDSAHRMTAMAVDTSSGEPVTVFTNEYDSSGRVVRQTLAGGSVYRLAYETDLRSPRNHVKLTEPSGRVLEIIRPSDNDFVVRSTTVRFPAVR